MLSHLTNHFRYSIELYLNANSTVTIAGVLYVYYCIVVICMASDGGSTTVDPAGIHGRTTPLWYVQVSSNMMSIRCLMM